jgi:hypothetical protein
MAEAYVTRCSNIRPKLEKLQIADLVDMPNINDIFKHHLVRIPKNFKELETTHHKTRKQISPAEAYVTHCSNILTELEKLQTTDLVHIPTDLLGVIQCALI